MNERITRRQFLEIAAASTSAFILAACGIDPTATQPTAEELPPTPVPSLSLSPEPSTTPTPTPTETSTPEPTPTPLYEIPDNAPDYLKDKVKEIAEAGLSLKVEVNPNYSEEDNGKSRYVIYKKNTDDEFEQIATADMETDKIRITTAKNEPFSLSTSQMEVVDGKLLISDERWGEEPILEFRNNGWESWDPDRLLYLAAVENPHRLEGSNYNKLPDDANGERPITGVSKIQGSNGTRNFDAILVDENTIGFYDPNGMLHTYEFTLPGLTYLGGTNDIPVCQPKDSSTLVCRVYPPEEAEEILKKWSFDMVSRQIGVQIFTVQSIPGYLLVEKLIEACESGENYPNAIEGSLPVLQITRYQP